MEHVHVEYHVDGSFKKQKTVTIPMQSATGADECWEWAEKVEAMLSTAVLHLADLWNMLALEFDEGVAFDPDTALLTPVTEIPPMLLGAMKGKVENSLEWCQLARSRLLDHITKAAATTTDNRQQPPFSMSWPMPHPSVSKSLTSFAAPSGMGTFQSLHIT